MQIAALFPLLLIFLSTAVFASEVSSTSLSRQVADGETFMGMRLHGTLRLPDTPINGLDLVGLSALAWDEDEQRLYAVSDFGRVFHLRPKFKQQQLHDVEFLSAFTLKDNKGRRLKYPWSNAEGLTLKNSDNGVAGDTELVVVYEVRPRIRRYTPAGKRLGGIELPVSLRNRRQYQEANRSLESITWHPRWGAMVAPEAPQPQRDKLTLYTLGERHWLYAPYAAKNSALVAIEALPDGSLLTLERAYTSPLRPLIISLRRVQLLELTSAALVEDVAVLNSAQGWRLDNFEGLTRHYGDFFFMVSDDNRSIWQNTLLVYFELL